MRHVGEGLRVGLVFQHRFACSGGGAAEAWLGGDVNGSRADDRRKLITGLKQDCLIVVRTVDGWRDGLCQR
jgi:hypothetical protein